MKNKIDKTKSMDKYVVWQKLIEVRRKIWEMFLNKEITRDKYEELHNYMNNKIFTLFK